MIPRCRISESIELSTQIDSGHVIKTKLNISSTDSDIQPPPLYFTISHHFTSSLDFRCSLDFTSLFDSTLSCALVFHFFRSLSSPAHLSSRLYLTSESSLIITITIAIAIVILIAITITTTVRCYRCVAGDWCSDLPGC